MTGGGANNNQFSTCEYLMPFVFKASFMKGASSGAFLNNYVQIYAGN